MARIPNEIIFKMLEDNWSTATIAKPKILQRETVGELRTSVPKKSGTILVFPELGGIREVPRGNRMYKDELANVVVECHTVKSQEHLYQMFEEVVRILESHTRDVSPFQVLRVASYAEEPGETYQYWKGKVRCELSRVAVRTAYDGPGSLTY